MIIMTPLFHKPEERLKWILKEKNLTAYKLAQILHYKSPDTIYHILKGENNLSTSFIQKLEKSDLKVNPLWLMHNIGEPFKYKLHKRYRFNHKSVSPADLDYYFIKNIGCSIADTFLDAPESYTIEARICGINGLEYKYTIYLMEERKAYIDKYYSVIIQADWKVVSFYEFYTVNHKYKTGEDLFSYTEEPTMINDTIGKIMNKSETEYENYDMEPFLKEKNYFQEIYKSDSRIINRHYKIFCVNGNTGFRKESRIFYFIHLQNEEDYERKESSSA